MDFSRIETKLDKIQEDVAEIKITQAVISSTLDSQAKILDTHIKRTEACEARLTVIEKIFATQKSFFSFMGWLIPVLITFFALIFGIWS